MAAGEWRIEARSLQLDMSGVSMPFYHDYWVLVNSNGEVVGELHGLAVDPNTGDVMPRGDSSCLLQMKVFNVSQYSSFQPYQPTVIAATGDQASIQKIWQKAVDMQPVINDQNLSYPDLWQQYSKPNSNSVFALLGYEMGFGSESWPNTNAPGLFNSLLINGKLFSGGFGGIGGGTEEAYARLSATTAPVTQYTSTEHPLNAYTSIETRSYQNGQTIYGKYEVSETDKDIASIAMKLDVTVAELKKNNILLNYSEAIYPGKVLYIRLPELEAPPPATSITNGITVTNTTNITTPSQSNATGENQVQNSVTQGIVYSDASTIISTANPAGLNNSTSLTDGVANSILSGGVMPGNMNQTDEYSFSLPSWETVMQQMGIGTYANNYGNASYFPVDPLVLDLNGDGVKLTDYASSPVLFDADHDGKLEQTGWVSAQDGIVVVDRNGNGKIDDISETLSEYYGGQAGTGGEGGTQPYKNGFDALKSLDSNKDGVFSSSDTSWRSVKVWVDSNHDGVMDAGEASELYSLDQLGITQINGVQIAC